MNVRKWSILYARTCQGHTNATPTPTGDILLEKNEEKITKTLLILNDRWIIKKQDWDINFNWRKIIQWCVSCRSFCVEIGLKELSELFWRKNKHPKIFKKYFYYSSDIKSKPRDGSSQKFFAEWFKQNSIPAMRQNFKRP